MKRSGFFLILCVLALGLAGELIARYRLGLGTPALAITHPTIEYVMRPDQDVRRFDNRIIINSYGMRSENFDVDKTDSETRVMIFGDSVLNGGNLIDQSELATTRLKSHIQSETGKSVVVGNISANSWGPGNWLAYANEFGFFDADMIGLVLSSHDYFDERTFGPLNVNSLPMQNPPSALIEAIYRVLRKISEDDARPATNNSVDLVGNKRNDNVLNELSEFLILAKMQGPVVVFHHWTVSELNNGTAEVGALYIADLCERLNVPFVSLQPVFKQSILQGVHPFNDNIHPNKVGQRLIGQALIEHFGSLRL